MFLTGSTPDGSLQLSSCSVRMRFFLRLCVYVEVELVAVEREGALASLRLSAQAANESRSFHVRNAHVGLSLPSCTPAPPCAGRLPALSQRCSIQRSPRTAPSLDSLICRSLALPAQIQSLTRQRTRTGLA